MKAAHYTGSYHVQARRIRTLAYANPDTRCGRCGRTLAKHPPTKTGKAARWQAGHVIDGQVNGALRPEADVCNAAAGARLRHQKPERTSRRW